MDWSGLKTELEETCHIHATKRELRVAKGFEAARTRISNAMRETSRRGNRTCSFQVLYASEPGMPKESRVQGMCSDDGPTIAARLREELQEAGFTATINETDAVLRIEVKW